MAFQLGPKDGENEDLAEINIIPLVDVMLVLLIIFMVTAPLSIGGINVNLPTSRAAPGKVSEDRIVLSVTKSGDFYVDKLQLSQESLPERLKAMFEFRENKDLYIRADRDVPYGRVIDAMSAARVAGISKMSMLTQPTGATTKK
jgi:biopolymer transport protein TolR